MMKKLIYSAFALAVLALTLTGCEDVPAPYNVSFTGNETPTATPAQPTGEGTMASPYNVAQALKMIKDGTFTENKVYIKGVITKKGAISTQYGNAVYYIGDSKSTLQTLEVYRGHFLNGAKFTSEDQISVGDTVLIQGQLTVYNTKAQVAQGSSIVTLNGQGGQPTQPETPSAVAPAGEGTEDSPYNIAKAQRIIADGQMSQDPVYISGTIVDNPTFDPKYGSMSYYLSDDGTTSGQLKVFGANSFNGAKFTAATQLKKGDKVVIKGILINFKGNTPEVNFKSVLISLNGKTELPTTSEGSTSETETPATTSQQVQITDTIVTLTNTAVQAGTKSVTVDLNNVGLKDLQVVTEVMASDESKIIFASGTNTRSVPKFYTKSHGVRTYANNTITFECKKPIAKIVFTCDHIGKDQFVGNNTQTIAFDGNHAVWTNVFNGAGGGIQLRVKTITITYAAES